MKRVLPLVMLSSLCLAQRPAPVELELMTYPEVYSAIHEQGKTTVLIFNGGTEQRGPHAVLGGHTFIARRAADEIARKLGNALVAPVLPFSPTGGFVKPQWPGTISVSPELYTKMNEAIVANMVVAGFKNIVLMGDHGGGQKQLEELAGSLVDEILAASWMLLRMLLADAPTIVRVVAVVMVIVADPFKKRADPVPLPGQILGARG